LLANFSRTASHGMGDRGSGRACGVIGEARLNWAIRIHEQPDLGPDGSLIRQRSRTFDPTCWDLDALASALMEMDPEEP
jgi:hypothetical protein